MKHYDFLKMILLKSHLLLILYLFFKFKLDFYNYFIISKIFIKIEIEPNEKLYRKKAILQF